MLYNLLQSNKLDRLSMDKKLDKSNFSKVEPNFAWLDLHKIL